MVSRILKRASESVEKRADDNEATIKNRIETFIRNTDEILSQYPNQTKRVSFTQLIAWTINFNSLYCNFVLSFASGGWWTWCWCHFRWSISSYFRSDSKKEVIWTDQLIFILAILIIHVLNWYYFENYSILLHINVNSLAIYLCLVNLEWIICFKLDKKSMYNNQPKT